MTYGPLFDNDAVIQAGAKPSVVCDYVKPYIMVAVSSRVIPVSSRMVVFTSRVIAVSSRVIAVSSPIKLSVHKSARSVLSELSCLKLPHVVLSEPFQASVCFCWTPLYSFGNV